MTFRENSFVCKGNSKKKIKKGSEKQNAACFAIFNSTFGDVVLNSVVVIFVVKCIIQSNKTWFFCFEYPKTLFGICGQQIERVIKGTKVIAVIKRM